MTWIFACAVRTARGLAVRELCYKLTTMSPWSCEQISSLPSAGALIWNVPPGMSHDEGLNGAIALSERRPSARHRMEREDRSHGRVEGRGPGRRKVARLNIEGDGQGD